MMSPICAGENSNLPNQMISLDVTAAVATESGVTNSIAQHIVRGAIDCFDIGRGVKREDDEKRLIRRVTDVYATCTRIINHLAYAVCDHTLWRPQSHTWTGHVFTHISRPIRTRNCNLVVCARRIKCDLRS